MTRLFTFFLALAAGGHAAVLTPSSISATSTFFTYDVQSLVDGSGLTNQLHDNTFSNMWLSDNLFPDFDPSTISLTVNFALPTTVASFSIWNYNYDEFGLNPEPLNRGVQTFALSWLSGSNFIPIAEYTLGRGTGQPLAASTFSFNTAITTTAFRLDILSNYGDRDYVGLSELQFLSAAPTSTPPSPAPVPEPHTCMLLTGGLAILLFRKRAVRFQ